MSEFSRETKPISRGGGGGIYYKVWALIIMEAEKSHNLLSVSWRTRKASGVVLTPEKWRIHGVGSHLGLKAWEPGTPRAREDQDIQLMLRVNSAFFCPIVLFGSSTRWMVATHIGELCLAQSLALFLHSAPIFVNCPFVNISSSNYSSLNVPSASFVSGPWWENVVCNSS